MLYRFGILLILCGIAECFIENANLHIYGTVAGGNFTYYSLHQKGPITLYLHSSRGDADLYISQFIVLPTYDPNQYCLHSASCGLDVVEIPIDFKRPVSIGIYGHPSFAESDFILELKHRSIDFDDPFYDNTLDISEDLFERNLEDELNEEDHEDEENIRGGGKFSFYDNMLDFEKEMLLDILNGDGLLIAAKGLSIETVVLNLIRVHCDPGNLVLIMGSTPEEEEYFITELRNSNVTPLPRVITAEVNTSEREEVYLSGGVLFVSSRILVVDLLKKRVPVVHITGFIVLRAHRILDMCQEAFALRLFRQENQTGFINAFSKSPLSFTLGMLKLERIMKTLFTNKLHLWPRFHQTISTSLKVKQSAVFEFRIPLSQGMHAIHEATRTLMDFCICEIKRLNPELSTEELTGENAISKSFHKMLQLRLDPVWNQLSEKTKQLIADLKILRSVLVQLTQSDCVRLHRYLRRLRTQEYIMKNSGWMCLPEAETLFVAAKNRLFDSKQNLTPESNPKWNVLNEILVEVQKKLESEETSNVLILVDSPSTIKQLKEVSWRNWLLHWFDSLWSHLFFWFLWL